MRCFDICPLPEDVQAKVTPVINEIKLLSLRERSVGSQRSNTPPYTCMLLARPTAEKGLSVPRNAQACSGMIEHFQFATRTCRGAKGAPVTCQYADKSINPIWASSGH